METEIKHYKFSTFQELVDRVPADKIQECLMELGKAWATAKAFAERVYRTASELAKKDGVVLPDTPTHLIQLSPEHEWIDDGKGECSVEISDYPNATLVIKV